MQIPGKKESTKKNQKIKPKKKTQKVWKAIPEKKTQKSEKYHLKIKYTFQKILPMPEQADPLYYIVTKKNMIDIEISS